VIETVTITVDVIETSWVAPAPTGNPVSLPPYSDSPDTVTTPPIVEPIPSGPPPAPSPTSSAPIVKVTPMKPGPENGKLVFAHFMVGVVSTYTYTDWKYDITMAKSYGIDGFALNIGKDPYTDAQLDLAYQAGKDTGFKMFISFDVSLLAD
jgi:glucan endo-1,3-alpha-glucosidase